MRRVLPLTLAIFLVVASVAPALAAGISFTGYVDSEIKFRPNASDRWTGRTGIEIGAALSATNKYSLKLGFFDEDKYFWEKYSSWVFQPSEISLYASGALWTGGPVLKGTLGDFQMLGPIYIAGDSKNAAVRGVMVEGLPLGVIRSSVYAGWQREDIAPLPADPKTKAWGGSVNIANYKGLSLNAYGAVRTGELVASRQSQAPDGEPLIFDMTDPDSASFSVTTSPWIALITKNWALTNWPASTYYDFAYLDAEGHILYYHESGQSKYPPPSNSNAQQYGYVYVIAARYSTSQTWMRQHLKPFTGQMDKRVILQAEEKPYPYTEMVGAVEGAYRVAGFDLKGQAGRFVAISKHPWEEVEPIKGDFRIFSIGTQLDILGKEVATKPLSLNIEYRSIDSDFTPWARSTDTDSLSDKYNRIEAQRGQKGINFVASTAFLPENPVDTKLTFDSYTKENKNYQSMSLELATVVSGYELTSKLGTDGTEVGVARNLDLGIKDITKFRPSLKLVMSPNSTTPTSVLGLSAVVSLGGFRNINLDASHEATGDESVTTFTGSYKAPNGWELKAGWTSDKEKVDDTYISLYYKVNL
ncbi:MAG: hypothetical protein IMX00_07775 [Limnochordales bacterium]|nr:hypothetical protein [Limnochordales bacterium]